MQFCLDISSIPYNTGVARYTSNLAKALAKNITPGDTFSVFGASLRQFKHLKSEAMSIGASRSYLYPIPPKISSSIFNQTSLNIDSLAGNSDVFHSWDWYLPASKKTKQVITIHDLAQFKFDQISHPEIRQHHRQVIDRIVKLKPKIIAVSEATKKDCIELFDLDPADISVIYEALPAESYVDLTLQDILDMRQTYKVGHRPYLLMVGTLEPRKNYLRQIQAWRKFKKEFDLVIAGRSGWETIKPETGLHLLGSVSGKDLAALYHDAKGLMYCSLAEGFGLPILEALHYQKPVLTSNTSSLNEIAADYTVKVDPFDVGQIEAGIERAFLLNEVTKSISPDEIAKKYSWDKAARETLEVYKKALKTNN